MTIEQRVAMIPSMRLLSLFVALTSCATQVVEVESTQGRAVLGVMDRCGYNELGTAPGRFVIRRSDGAFLRVVFDKWPVRYFALSQDPTVRLRVESGLPDLTPDQSPQFSTKLRREVKQLLNICYDVLWTGDPNGDRLEGIRVATSRIVAESENAKLRWLLTNLESMCAVRVQIEPEGALSWKFWSTLHVDIEIIITTVAVLL